MNVKQPWQTTRPLRNLLGLAGAIVICAGAAQSATIAPVKLQDTSGAQRQIPASGAPATVLLFIADDCPIANSYAPTMERITRAYSRRGVAFFTIYAEEGLSNRQARKHDQAYSLSAPSIASGWRKLVQQTGVIVTPEAVVLAPNGKIMYRGRIDNWFAALGVQRQIATTHDLESALDAVLSHRAVPQPETTPVGCYIASGVR